MPTRPGQVPLQLATVNTGPRCSSRPGKHVMGVLPHRLGHDDRRIFGNLAEHFQAVLLAVDEAVLLRRIIRVGAFHLVALTLDRGDELPFHLGLRRFAFLIGGQAQVTACYQINRFHLKPPLCGVTPLIGDDRKRSSHGHER